MRLFLHDGVAQPCLTSSRVPNFCNDHSALLFVLAYPIDTLGGGWVRALFDHCPILFGNVAAAKLFRQPFGGFRSAREHNHTRRNGVESTDNTQVSVARFVVFCFQITFCNCSQSLLSPRCSHRREIGRFVYHQEVVIFVQYVQGDRHTVGTGFADQKERCGGPDYGSFPGTFPAPGK